MGIEPTRLAWEARALPLSYTRVKAILIIHRTRLKVNSDQKFLIIVPPQSPASVLAHLEITLEFTLDTLQGVVDRLDVTVQIDGDLLV